MSLNARPVNRAAGRVVPDHVLEAHRKVPVLLRAIWLAACAGIAVAFLSGCMAQAARMQLEETIVAKKAQSLKGWETVTLDGVPILEILGERTAIVFCNFESISVWIDDSGFTGEGTPRANAQTSTAAPISTDGYFLTAAHSVEDAETLNLSVAVRQEDGHLQIKTVTARVVWRSEGHAVVDWHRADPKLLQDFAIIHADVGPLAPFKLAEELPQIDEPIIGAGWPLEHFDSFPAGAILAAGHILSIVRLDAGESTPAGVAILIDTPLVSGDSGGPVLDRKGNLIGIHSQVRIRMSHFEGVAMLFGHAPSEFEDFEYSAVAYLADPNWINEVIEIDRKSRSASPGSSTPKP